MRTGAIDVRDVPEPELPDTGALVRVRVSLISAGTERSKLETGAESLIGKARSRPDAVAKVVESFKREGIRATVDLVRSRLDSPEPLGYSATGVVEGVGRFGGSFRIGQRVACGGGGVASHAELIAVPRNLMVVVPDEVTDEAAAYTTVGAVALQGLRQAEVALGDEVLVIGLGLVGQLTCQLAAAAGCRVTGLDPDSTKADLVTKTPSVQGITHLGNHHAPFDAAIIAAATASTEPIETATRALRDRGRIVVVGDVGLKLDRNRFYEKELDLRFSRSYGPGRYDVLYEQLGVDYPIGYVRWTEQRNMAAFLRACAVDKVDPSMLTTHRFPIEDARDAYGVLEDPDQHAVGVLLDYPQPSGHALQIPARDVRPPSEGVVGVGVIGVGRFATRTLIPTLRASANAEIRLLASERGLSTAATRKQSDALEAASVSELLDADDIEAVVIATRHDSHAALVTKALERGKHVFVEKPLTRVEEEIPHLVEVYNHSQGVCFVDFNRRFAPATAAVLQHFEDTSGPKEVLIRVNAGMIGDHWLNDPEIGGGRLVGEGSHFVDLASHLVGRPPDSVSAIGVPVDGRSITGWESFTLHFDYADGSIATVVYTTSGASGVPKERIEVMGAGRTAVVDDFRRWELWTENKVDRQGGSRVDKGHRRAVEAFLTACQTGSESLPFSEAVQSMLATFAALRAVGSGRREPVPRVDVEQHR